jgi:hypothetical protein
MQVAFSPEAIWWWMEDTPLGEWLRYSPCLLGTEDKNEDD